MKQKEITVNHTITRILHAPANQKKKETKNISTLTEKKTPISWDRNEIGARHLEILFARDHHATVSVSVFSLQHPLNLYQQKKHEGF